MKKNQSNNMQTLADVNRRKMELKLLMDGQKNTLLNEMHQIGEDLKPVKIAFEFLRSFFNETTQEPDIAQLAVNSIAFNLAGNVKNKKYAPYINIALRLLIPVLPKIVQFVHEKVKESHLIEKANTLIHNFLMKFHKPAPPSVKVQFYE